MEETKEQQEKQISETNWFHDGGRCKVRIETDGDLSKEDVKVQAIYTIYGLGYGINIEETENDELE